MVWLKWIRPLNLVIMAAAQLLFVLCLTHPHFHVAGWVPELAGLNLYLLLISTIFIGAGGYMINDIQDVDIDEVNKPGKNPVGSKIPVNLAYRATYVSFVIAIAAAAILAYRTGNVKLASIQIVVIGLLYWYATSLKKVFFLGNMVVALTTALVFILPLVYEPILFDETVIDPEFVRSSLFRLGLGYAIFAFLMTMVREIIKDMEDLKGDDMYGCRTIPVVLGITGAKWAVAFFAFITMGALVWVLEQMADQYITVYGWLLIHIPLLYLLTRLMLAKKTEVLSHLSLVTKLIMIFGLASIYLIYYLNLRA